MRALVIPAAATLATLGLLALSRGSASAPVPPGPPGPPVPPGPVPPVPPVPPLPDMSKWRDDEVLVAAKNVIVDHAQDKLKASDAPYVCALSRRMGTVFLPFGAQFVFTERLRTISVNLDPRQCGLFQVGADAQPKQPNQDDFAFRGDF